MATPILSTRTATLRCTRASRLGQWFLRETLAIDAQRARAILDQGEAVEVVLDRYRVARFERAASLWDLEFEFDPPFAELRASLVRTESGAARLSVRISGPVQDKFRAIARVRELTELSLADARRVVSSGAPFVTGLRPAEAAELVARFAEVGATAEAVAEGDQWIAFDPRHRARGDQPLERLARAGLSLTHERGQLGVWDTAGREDFGDEAELVAAREDQLGRWRAAGLEVAHAELELLSLLSPREPSLEASLRAAETLDCEAARVYADWLEARGDPRGPLASLQLARAGLEPGTEAARALGREIQGLIERHRCHLFGPFAGGFTKLRPKWAAGLLRSVQISRSLDELGAAPGAVLDQLLDLPVAAALRELGLSGEWLSHADLATSFLHEAVTGLRKFRLMVHANHDFAGFPWVQLERLEQLQLFAYMGKLNVDSLRLPALRELTLGLGPLIEATSLDLHNADLPRLERVELNYRGRAEGSPEDDELEHLATILSAPWASSLAELTVHRNARGRTGLDFVECVLASPAAASVEHLDLHGIWLDPRAQGRVRAFGAERGIRVSI